MLSNGAQNDGIELCSFHSVSKGVFGECGQRGGYVDLVGIDEDVKDCLYKLAASKLCSNAPGQAMVSLMCRGPEKGDVSYESHEKEKRAVFEGLRGELSSDMNFATGRILFDYLIRHLIKS
jgi:alanine transaminase